MLPEAKKKLIFTIVVIVGVIIVIIIMYNLAKFMKNHGESPEVVYDDPYPTIYDYYAIEYSDEGTYKLIGFDENFTRNDLDLRIFFPTNTLYWRNNHLAFYSDATNELRYNSEEEKYYLYELDTFYSNNVDIKIVDDYLILIENNTLSYRKIDSDDTKEITNQLVNKDILINENYIYYVVSAGVYEYDLETGSSKLIMIKGSNAEQRLIAISNKFLIVQSVETLYSYEFKNGDLVTINDRLEEEEGTSIKFVGLIGTTLVYQIEKEGDLPDIYWNPGTKKAAELFGHQNILTIENGQIAALARKQEKAGKSKYILVHSFKETEEEANVIVLSSLPDENGFLHNIQSLIDSTTFTYNRRERAEDGTKLSLIPNEYSFLEF